MRLRERYRRLSFWNKIEFWGAIASILALILWLAAALMPPERKATTLIDLLDVRAARIVRMLEDDKQAALASIQSGHGWVGMNAKGHSDSVEAFVQRTDRTKAVFLELHQAHIDALRRGDYVVAHELVNDIHYLIYAHYQDLAGSAYRDPLGQYAPGRYPTGAALYPGKVPQRFIDSVPTQTLLWWADAPSYLSLNDVNDERLERILQLRNSK